MSTQAFSTPASDSLDQLVILTNGAATRFSIVADLAASAIPAIAKDNSITLNLGDRHWKTIIESLALSLNDQQLADTRIALIPKNADEPARRKALVFARPIAKLLEEYSDAWLCDVMQRNALLVHFQPIVQYPPGRIHGYECLLRGTTKTGQILPPRKMFDSAKRLGMQYLLDKQAIRLAVNIAADMGFTSTQYFINMMAGAIDDPKQAAENALAIIQVGGLRPDQFTFEIVDSESIRSHRHLADIIEQYRALGFSVALDDVGAGAASLLCLRDLKPDYIKLDATLCQNAVDHSHEATVLKQIIRLARANGIITIAKGIESEPQLRFCIDAGIKVTQGFIHSNPEPFPLDATGEDNALRQVRRTAILAI